MLNYPRSLTAREKKIKKNDEEVRVDHQEHKEVMIPHGIWEVTKVKEYDHFEEEARNVRD